MTANQWVILAVAVLGVLHGPAFAPLWRMLRKGNKPK